MSEQSLEEYLGDVRTKIFDEQPNVLVLHNSLRWAVKDISLNTDDKNATLELWELPSVTCQVPMKTCFVLKNYAANPRAGARRVRYLEIQELNFSYVIGPTPSRIDERGNAHQLSNSWMSPAPMVFWPRGNYNKIHTSNDPIISYEKNAGLHPRIYTFQPNPNMDEFKDVHEAMQHLNLRPDIYAQCGNPRFRGAKSWTYTCTAAATESIYIDEANGNIQNINRWTVSVYEWSSFATTADASIFEWAIPVKTNQAIVPLAIGADLMGPRTSVIGSLTPPSKVKLGTSPFKTLKNLSQTPVRLRDPQFVSVVGMNQAFLELETTANEEKKTIFKAKYANFDEKINRKDFLQEFAKFVQKNQRFSATFPYAHLLYEKHGDEINAFDDADDASFPITKLQNAITLALSTVDKEILQGAEWEFLWAKCDESLRTSIEQKINKTKLIQAIVSVGVKKEQIIIGKTATPSTPYFHWFNADTKSHNFTSQVFTANPKLESNHNQTGAFAFQKSNLICSWDSTPHMIGTFSFLHTTAPMRPKSTTTSRAYKTPIHIIDLIQMAYGDGTYPNILTLAPFKNAVVMLEPELPTYQVLQDLYAHIETHASQAVLSSAIAAYGPIGVTGPSAITWTVLYEYYHAMNTPQNAFMQYLVALDLGSLGLNRTNGTEEDEGNAENQEQTLNNFIVQAGMTYVTAEAIKYILGAFEITTTPAGTGIFLAQILPHVPALFSLLTSSLSSSPPPKNSDIPSPTVTTTKTLKETDANGNEREKTVIETKTLKTLQDLIRHYVINGVDESPIYQMLFQKIITYANSTSPEETTILEELKRTLKRSNVVSAGLISKGYYISRVPLNITPELSPDIVSYLQSQWEIFSNGRIKVSGLSVIQYRQKFLASKAYKYLPLMSIQEQYRKTLEYFNPQLLNRTSGKVDPSYLSRISSANLQRYREMITTDDILYICMFGWEKVQTIPFHQAELIVSFCSNAVAHERFASIPMRQNSGRTIASFKTELDTVLTTHIRTLGTAPLPRPQAPQLGPTAKFRVVIPVGTQTPQSTLQWVTSNPSMCGFGFVTEMTEFGSKAINMPTVLNDLSQRIATAVALVYARNVLIRSAWLKKAQHGPQFGVNAPVTHRVPDDAPRGLLPTSALAELFTE